MADPTLGHGPLRPFGISINGVPVASRQSVNFVGTGITVADDPTADTTTITVAGGGGDLPDPLLVGDGAAGAPAVAFTSDPDTGIFRSADNSISLTAGGVTQLTAVAGVTTVPKIKTGAPPDGAVGTIRMGNVSAGSWIVEVNGTQYLIAVVPA